MLINQNLVFTPYNCSPKIKYWAKSVNVTKKNKIEGTQACRAKSSMDQNNIDIYDIKIKLAALKKREKSLSF